MRQRDTAKTDKRQRTVKAFLPGGAREPECRSAGRIVGCVTVAPEEPLYPRDLAKDPAPHRGSTSRIQSIPRKAWYPIYTVRAR